MKTPSEEYNLPVIGRIYCKLTATVDGKPLPLAVDEDEYDVIKILENNDNKIYVCNQWNSPGKAQFVPEVFVIRYEDK